MKITLCGSARFEQWFRFWDEMFSLCGHIVYNLAVYPSDKKGEKNWYTEEQKNLLDKVHKNKILESDAIFLINPFGYIGDSTKEEIEFAKHNNKKMYALESWGVDCGVGCNHYKAIRNLKKSFGIEENYVSPIDTTSNNFKSIYTDDEIIGPAGKLRSFVAASDDEFKYEILK